MSTYFAPLRASTPPAISDVSRSSALSTAELTRLTPDQVEFLDAVIRRAPPSATTFIHIFKAYNDVINERGLDAENEVEYYKKLLKIGTLKGENWASKWRAVKAQNGYTVPKQPLPRAALTTLQTHHLPAKVTPIVPQPQSSTARLLQRLKGLQHGRPVEPSESPQDDLFSRTDVTDTEADSPPRAIPLPGRGRSLSELTTTDNTLGLDVGPLSSHPPSSTLAPSKPTGWRWPERDPEIDKSVPFLTSTPPLSPHRFASRPTPASGRQQVSRPLPIASAPRAPLADLRTLNQPTTYQDDAWDKINVAQGETLADQFRNERLLQQCFDVWRQGQYWIATTTTQVAHAHNTFVLRVAIHKWRAALTQRREFVVRADARANAFRQKAALAFWHTRLQERRKAAWRADMRMRMQTVRSLRESALRRDVWAHWRQLYQSRLLRQRLAGHLIERCFEQWKGQLREMNSMKRRADEFVAARRGEVVIRCWDSWRRAAELRGAERVIAERVVARVVRESMAFWYQRMREHQRADALHDVAVKRFAFSRWRTAYSRILTLERRADRQIARQEDALVRAVVRVWKAHERGLLLERLQNAKLLKQAWEAWKKRLQHQGELQAAALAFTQRSQIRVASSAVQVWHRRLSMQQGAHAFAVQYANVQLQFRLLFKWRVQLRAHLKLLREAKIADKFFLMRRAWRRWLDKAEMRGREKRLREWNKGRVAKQFAGWKEKALRLRRHRLAEHQIQTRANTRVLKDALGHWTNRVIAVKLRELEVVQQKDKAIVQSAFCKWKKVCIRHVEELSLMESYQDVKREENMRRMFYKWLAAARKLRHKRVTLQERETEMRRIQLEAAWDKWRGRFQAERLVPLERTFVLQSRNATMYRAFAIWCSKTRSLPAVHFHASHVRAKFWKFWRDAIPRALQAKRAREMDQKAVLSRVLEKWLQVCRTKVALRAVARARQMRLPTSYQPALTHRMNPPPSRPGGLLRATPVRPSSPPDDTAAVTDISDQGQRTRPTRASPSSLAQPKPRPAILSLLSPSSHNRRDLHDASSMRPKLSARSTDAGRDGPKPREPSPARSVVSQPPSTVAAVEARASLWADLKDIRRRSRTPAALPTRTTTMASDGP